MLKVLKIVWLSVYEIPNNKVCNYKQRFIADLDFNLHNRKIFKKHLFIVGVFLLCPFTQPYHGLISTEVTLSVYISSFTQSTLVAGANIFLLTKAPI